MMRQGIKTIIAGASMLLVASSAYSAQLELIVKSPSTEEVKRLETVISQKNKALELAIDEIKKLHTAKDEQNQRTKQFWEQNQGVQSTMESYGWKRMEFGGLGAVEVKQSKGSVIIKVKQSDVTVAAAIFAGKATSQVRCGLQTCFVLPDSAININD